MVKFFIKISLFFAGFAAVYYFFRTSDFYTMRILASDLGGAQWLYSLAGSIYGMITAFVINQQWGQWNHLADSVKGEVDALDRLHRWANNFPDPIKEKVQGRVVKYLHLMIREGLHLSESGIRSQAVEDALNQIERSIFEMFDTNPDLVPTSFSIFSDILQARTDRIKYSTHRVPDILRFTLFFAALILIGLSLFISGKNIPISYVFTASVATLVYIIFLVIDDLNNPLKPGAWYITSKDYKELLEKIER